MEHLIGDRRNQAKPLTIEEEAQRLPVGQTFVILHPQGYSYATQDLIYREGSDIFMRTPEGFLHLQSGLTYPEMKMGSACKLMLVQLKIEVRRLT